MDISLRVRKYIFRHSAYLEYRNSQIQWNFYFLVYNETIAKNMQI